MLSPREKLGPGPTQQKTWEEIERQLRFLLSLAGHRSYRLLERKSEQLVRGCQAQPLLRQF
jgi:hypothetical protein